MKVRNFIFGVSVAIATSGCYLGPATYELFEKNRESQIENVFIPIKYPKLKEIYDENRYIYKFQGQDPRCVYGYFTNRDDRSERVIGWIILSGEEFCKDRQAWTCCF
ncbi:hypothetical protein U5B43_10370 [Campylobacter sp. 9BO]|uniref:hypothetical protein n=1 Tax=unclassified Campylobacter TaxID=2593542 RepID=UPI003D32EE32